ncbi:Detected protein of unknown function [Hibiscus syriacus]|uniref:Amine oxidase domain-containing protein n=1 Tax=Hibiscus syriacus TaxID=106335 RepID=A0A6A2XB82_HIBSY|nr:Detected protein of unknown function [Hibiscus syriacus]
MILICYLLVFHAVTTPRKPVMGGMLCEETSIGIWLTERHGTRDGHAALGFLQTLNLLWNYLLLKHFDVVFCRGSTTEKIFEPWVESLKAKGCEILEGKRVTYFKVDEETGCITEVVSGKETYTVDAAILLSGSPSIKKRSRTALRKQEEFRKVLNLAGIDFVTVKLRLDREVGAQIFPWFRTEYHGRNLVFILIPSNACAGFDDLFGCAFFDLTTIHDEHKGDTETILQADFYHANELLPLEDELVVEKVMSYLSKCIDGLERANVVDKEIRRFPNGLTHIFPGDWIITRHGSRSQEKSYVTGLEAANRVVDYLEEGSFSIVIPVEEDEPHIEAFCNLNRRLNEIINQVPLSGYFLQ